MVFCSSELHKPLLTREKSSQQNIIQRISFEVENAEIGNALVVVAIRQ